LGDHLQRASFVVSGAAAYLLGCSFSQIYSE
jgi:hypothetical protein